MTVAIIDYGSGNLHSARKAFERAACDCGLSMTIEVTADPNAVRRADHVVLPGVGAFADCARGLRALDGMTDALDEIVRPQIEPQALDFRVPEFGADELGGGLFQRPGTVGPEQRSGRGEYPLMRRTEPIRPHIPCQDVV